ncbi:MAG: preprotein translocase subunit SecE [candidate division WS1 bacterium]|jgi:preprotein translocase subunit SecE|nr:preprotein translocase subunit SecE [candidate division WS1 bacterium]
MATAQRDKGGILDRLKSPFVRLFDFLGEVWHELHRVSWPTHQETYAFTVVVIIAIVIVSVWVGIWDLAFTQLLALLNM